MEYLNKTVLISIVIFLVFIISIKFLYKGELFNNYESLNIFQIGQSLYIQAPTTDSFYGFSYKRYYEDRKQNKIVVQFFRKYIFLTGDNQSDILNILLHKEGKYNLYYLDSKGQEQFIKEVEYNKSYDNKCIIINSL